MSSAARTTRLLAAGVALMAVAGFVPWLVLTLIGWSALANLVILPGIAVTVACVTSSGWRAGLLIVGPFAVLSGLAVWASSSPWVAAVILAVAAFLRGHAARAGVQNSLTLTVITLGFLVAMPPQLETSLSAPLVVAIGTLGAGLWAILTLIVVGPRIPHPKPTPLTKIRVLAFSLTLAVLVGLSTLMTVAFHLGQTGGWIILTILVVFQPALGAGFRKARDRALGTVIGLGVTVLIGLVVPTGPLLYLLGFIFMIVTFLFLLQGRPYWLYAAALTPGVVLINSAVSQVSLVATERLMGTIIGIAATLLVMLCLSPLSHHLEATTAPHGKA